jgi:hypothetical protein
MRIPTLRRSDIILPTGAVRGTIEPRRFRGDGPGGLLAHRAGPAGEARDGGRQLLGVDRLGSRKPTAPSECTFRSDAAGAFAARSSGAHGLRLDFAPRLQSNGSTRGGSVRPAVGSRRGPAATRGLGTPGPGFPSARIGVMG